MTIHDINKYYDGIGYRMAKVSTHRGSSGEGYINTSYYLAQYFLLNQQHFTSSLYDVNSLTINDFEADDWIPKKLTHAVNGYNLLKLVYPA